MYFPLLYQKYFYVKYFSYSDIFFSSREMCKFERNIFKNEKLKALVNSTEYKNQPTIWNSLCVLICKGKGARGKYARTKKTKMSNIRA